MRRLWRSRREEASETPRRAPLRRRVGHAYVLVWRVFRAWWLKIFGLAAIVFLPLGLVDAATADLIGSLDPDHDIELLALFTASGLALATGLLGQVFFAGAIGLSLTHRHDGPPLSLTFMARNIRYGRLILLDLIYVLIILIGVILLIVPGVVAFVLFALAGPAIEIEHRGVRAALARSYRLVRADFWLVFWVLMPIELLGAQLSRGSDWLVGTLVGDGFLAAGLAEGISNVVLSPIFAVAAVLLAIRLIARVDGTAPGLDNPRAPWNDRTGAKQVRDSPTPG